MKTIKTKLIFLKIKILQKHFPPAKTNKDIASVCLPWQNGNLYLVYLIAYTKVYLVRQQQRKQQSTDQSLLVNWTMLLHYLRGWEVGTWLWPSHFPTSCWFQAVHGLLGLGLNWYVCCSCKILHFFMH